MQSHASRRVVSNYLAELHPDLSPPFERDVIKTEIADAYGRRAIPKLIAVLALEQFPDEDRSHALRVFNGLISTQEHKTNAVLEGAAPPLLKLVQSSSDMEVRTLSCNALANVAQVAPGRKAIAEADGLEVLTDALGTTPQAAAGAFRCFATCNDGVALLESILSRAVPALVLLCSTPALEGVSLKACEHAAATLAGIAVNDTGVLVGLDSQLPRSLVALLRRGLTGEFRFEPELMLMIEQAALCLARVCHHPYGKTQTREAEPFDVLKMLLLLQHRGVVRNTVAALMGLSIEKEAKELTMLHCGMVLTQILRNEGDAELSGNARSALRNCSEDLKARRMLEMFPLSTQERAELLFGGTEPPAPPDYWYKVDIPQPSASFAYERQ